MRADDSVKPGGEPSGGGLPRPRAIVFDLFGDYVRYAGGAIRLRALARLLGAFDVPDDTTRVVMQRLRREGWFEGERVGRETVYSPTARAWEVLDEGRERIFNRAERGWDGDWCMLILSVPESERGVRDRLRRRLTWLGFGSLAPGVWLSAHDRVAEVQAELAEAGSRVQADFLSSRSAGPAADREIAGRCWDLDLLDRDYAAFAREVGRRLSRGSFARLSGEQALIERVKLIHRYRMFPFRDPDLPRELLADDWHGGEAHEAFLGAREVLRPAAAGWYAEVVGDPSAAQLLQ